MMVNISISTLKSSRGSLKPLIEAVLLNFVYAPIVLYFLSSLFIPDQRIVIAMLLLAVAPASSMGLGYLGLSEGHLVTGAIIVATAFILSTVAYPLLGVYVISGTELAVPLNVMITNLLLVLVLPLILGVATREYIEKKHGKTRFKNLKPYFSTITLTFLYVLLFLIFASKAKLIVKNYMTIVMIAPVAIIYYLLTISLAIFINKKVLLLPYGQHQAVVFTSIGKNVALTIAILVSVFGQQGQYMAIAPAIVSIFQAPFLMLYLKYSDKVKEIFREIDEEVVEKLYE